MKNIFLFIVILALPAIGMTTTIERGDRIHISSLHEIDDDLYAFGENIIIDGEIDGDLISGGYIVKVNGKLSGSTNVFAYEIFFSGKHASIRSFCAYEGLKIKLAKPVFGGDTLYEVV